MATNSAKVLATRDIIFYYKSYHASNILPANTVLWGTAWGTPAGQTGAWVDGGFTQGGLGFSAEISRTDIRMDQSLDPVLRPATGRTVSMTANLGEFNLASVVTATGQGSVATLAATTGVRGYDEWSMGSTVADNFYSTAFDVQHPGDDEAVRVVMETSQASVTILQRRLRLGYSRAARLIDIMEQEGLVGPYVGSKPREILINREEWLLKNVSKNASG